MMDKSAKDCLVLFDTSVEGRLTEGWASGTLLQRVKTIKAGPMVYVKSYPIWDTKTALAARKEAAKEKHRKAQQELNRRNAEEKLEWLINANFGAGDLILTHEYGKGENPETEEQAMRDVQNYLGRLRTLRNSRGLPPLKYIYVIEETNSRKNGRRLHAHIIMNGDGITREEAEEKWSRKHGGFSNSRRAQPDRDNHLSGFARYLAKSKQERRMEEDGKNPQKRAMSRRWNCSKNLKRPERAATTADKKISVRKAGRIAETAAKPENAREIFARLYPECELVEIFAKRSQFATGVYIAAKLIRRREGESGDKQKTRGVSGSQGGRRAGNAVPMGGAAGGEIPGIKNDVPHPERRKTRKGGSDPV